ncbi:helix-turn-helix domain-containing protein [Clostridium pasteurianum]|uniref:Transposase n=1 Tax=Clostridium pasteurianum BC1 TaxID=86416 RepID=R4K075_CLOPA|nr:helix-turn-helix domain-containing protein [Clostridium pasteurianum]AGK95186.1 Transposase [Clostridium pasteurianum BC1]
MLSEVISQQQEDMITMIMQGRNITDISKKLKVTRSTIYSWIKKDNIKAEIESRKHEIVNEGNSYILRDLKSYIDNVKELASDKSDKRVCLAANQYLINRIYGNPTSIIDTSNGDVDNTSDTNHLEELLIQFKNKKQLK